VDNWYILILMKAAVLEEINGPLTVAEVELGQVSFGQVLVKILVSGICGSQLQEIAGNKGNAKFVPHLLGHEGCGIVEEVGVGVTRVKKGDKVVMHWRKGEGIESDFPNYMFKDKKMPSGKITTFSEYSIVSENRLTPVPADTPNELCALLGCSLSTALGTVNIEANLKLGESLMIIGAGGLGINLIKAGRLVSAYPIISVDIFENKRALAEELGASLFINSKEEDIRTAIEKKFGIKDIDVIIDTSGNPEVLKATIPLLSGTGRYIMVGQPKPGATVELENAYHFFGGVGKVLRATQGGAFSPSTDIPRYVKLYNGGVLKIDGIISHRMKLNDINEAITLVRQGQAGRILIDPN
jgi:S-(hydroxymethyl)glutathione dehydrogenase/alcohol dehydrogenase